MPLSCSVIKSGRDILMCPLDDQPDSMTLYLVLLLQQGPHLLLHQNFVALHSCRIGNVIGSLGLETPLKVSSYDHDQLCMREI